MLLTVLSGMRLMRIQIVGDETIAAVVAEPGSFTFTREVPSTRGEIMDYSGHILVANDSRCDLVLQKAFFPEELSEGNRILLEIHNALEEHGYSFEEHIPVSLRQPYDFTAPKKHAAPDINAEAPTEAPTTAPATASSAVSSGTAATGTVPAAATEPAPTEPATEAAAYDEAAVNKMIELLKLNVYATADNCIDKLIADYSISDKYTPEEQRIIAGMRYEMLISDFSYSNPLVLAKDVDPETIVDMKELSNFYKGINAVNTAERRIVRGDILPHEIGTVGPIYAEEFEALKEQGYALSDEVGKSGIELALEKELRGQSGKEEVTLLNGAITNIKTTQEVVPGQTVQLTVDGSFQLKLQNILEDFLRTYSRGGLAKAGALVVLDAKTGAVRGMATAPTFNLKDYADDYESLLNTANNPLFDRCTYGQYLPGSTFKTVTATAGLNEGVISGDTSYPCNQTFYYHGGKFSCTGNHGYIAVRRAIQVSCNSFFYQLSDALGIDNITKYANLYGLGYHTGIETGDAEGFLCNPETFALRGQEWYIGYVIQAGIGNQDCGFTPLQLANVACTIANRGTRLQPYLVDSLYNYGSNELTRKTQATVAGEIPLNYSNVYDYIIGGMMDAATNMPYEYSLSNLGYSVAIKTGTPQTDYYDKSKQNSLFIGFAPAYEPEVAFAGVIEGGEYSKYMIRGILNAYQECYGLNGVEPTATLPPEFRGGTYEAGTDTSTTDTGTGTGTDTNGTGTNTSTTHTTAAVTTTN
ncbi:MAG TPA: hypothetical protein DCZ71_04055 [Ruminococcus sp.]|nr:hypothetical protein [Ruminococcus sp.]